MTYWPNRQSDYEVVSERAHAIDEEELTRFVTFAPAHELASLALAEAGRRSLSAAAVQRRAGAYAQRPKLQPRGDF